MGNDFDDNEAAKFYNRVDTIIGTALDGAFIKVIDLAENFEIDEDEVEGYLRRRYGSEISQRFADLDY